MRTLGISTCSLTIATVIGCTGTDEWNGSLEDFLQSRPNRFGSAMLDPAKHRVQIIYTQIDRDADNRPTFTSFRYRVDAGEYFYPASTVKLPTALLALEKLNRLGIEDLTRDTTMLTGVADKSQSPVIDDPSDMLKYSKEREEDRRQQREN